MKTIEVIKFMENLNKGLREQSIPETLIINPDVAASYTMTYFYGLWRTTESKPDFRMNRTVFGVSPNDSDGFATIHFFRADQSNVSDTELEWNEVAFNYPGTRWCYLEELIPMDIHINSVGRFGIGEDENEKPSPSC